MANEYQCPKCGSLLVRKHGRYGDFMACPGYPDCQYTKALWTFKTRFCDKCKNTGFLPFIKNGKVIPHVRVDCECREQPEHYFTITPDMIDFPVSWDWHRHYCGVYGLPDPGPCEPPGHGVGELHERVLALEESSQLIEKPKLEVYRPHEKPKPKLAEGVKL